MLQPWIVELENASFNPSIFASTGGAGRTATRAMKHLAAKISARRAESYVDSIPYISIL